MGIKIVPREKLEAEHEEFSTKKTKEDHKSDRASRTTGICRQPGSPLPLQCYFERLRAWVLLKARNAGTCEVRPHGVVDSQCWPLEAPEIEAFKPILDHLRES